MFRPDRPPFNRLMLAGAFVLLTLLLSPPGAGAQEGGPLPPNSSLVTIVHGLRGQLVDVYVDNAVLLPAYAPDRLTDPTPISAGDHRITLRKAGAPADSTPQFDQTVTVPAGKNLSAVAHFTPAGEWTVSVFDNGVAAPPADKAQVVFRNAAGVAPIDVSLNGSTTVSALATSKEASATVAPQTYSVQVSSSGDGSVLLPANDVPITSGDTTFLYLVGQPTGLTWLAQTMDPVKVLGAVLPSSVRTGNSGLRAAYDDRDDSWSWSTIGGVALAGVAALGASALVTTRRRRRWMP